MKFSIIIVNFNSGDYLLYTLRSIVLNPPSGDYEVIIIDNDSRDGSIEKAKKVFPQFKYVLNRKNLGYGAGCNLGAKLAKGEILIFSNADIIITNGTFDKVKKHFEENKKIGIIGAKLFYPDGTFQASCRRYPRFKYLLFGRKSIGSSLLKNNPITREFLYLDLKDIKEPVEVEGVVGAFMAIKKEIFFKIGGFDKRFFLFAEDIDLCLRIKKEGYKVIHDPTIKVIHFHGQSRRYLGLKSDYFLKKSIYKFFYKHNSINFTKKIILNLGLALSTGFSSLTSIFYKNDKH